MTPRRPPTSAVFAAHLPRRPGKCDWCGEPCEERTAVRQQIKRRHDRCNDEYLTTIRPDFARAMVFARDRGICALCGEDWSERWRPIKGLKQYLRDDGIEIVYSSILWVSLWHVDHRVPLWKVVHMPDLERIAFFKLANLQTLCDPCHGGKTAREAAERAHHNELARRRAPVGKLPF